MCIWSLSSTWIGKGEVHTGLLSPAVCSALGWVRWGLPGKGGHSPRTFWPSGGQDSKVRNHSGTLGVMVPPGGAGLEPGGLWKGCSLGRSHYGTHPGALLLPRALTPTTGKPRSWARRELQPMVWGWEGRGGELGAWEGLLTGSTYRTRPRGS